MKCAQCGSYNTTLDKGPLLVSVPVPEGQEKKYRPLTEAEEKLLAGATFPPEQEDDSDPDDEDGWETNEEDLDQSSQLHEEELD